VVYEGKCFYVHEEPQRFSYEEAKAYCANNGGQIASIHSEEENSAVLPLVDQRSSYIGATRECASATDCGPWRWEDGSEWVEPTWPTDKLNSNGGTWKNGETHIVIHKDKKWHDWERGQVVKDVLCQFATTTTPKSPFASLAGEYHVWYRGAQRSVGAHVGCDGSISQPGIFADSLHTTGVREKCRQDRDSKATFVVYNTHGRGKYECLWVEGSNIVGHHYTGDQRYWGTIEYRLASHASCS
jgi:hypothetical protein